MTYDLKRSFGSEQKERSLSDAAVLAEEGQALVFVTDASGVSKVQPSAGSASERFAGFSKTANSLKTTEVIVETLVIPAAPGPYTLTLSKSNISPTGVSNVEEASAVASTTGTLTQVAGAPAAGQFAINPVNGVVTFNVAQAGETVVIQYRHALTQLEINAKYQSRHMNNLSVNAETRSVSVIGGDGEMYTDQYDASLVYTLNEPILTGAGGKITNAGSGTAIGYCCKLPGANADGFLGVNFRKV